jgi:hypothetical protein
MIFFQEIRSIFNKSFIFVEKAPWQLFKEQDNPDRFRLSFNGQNIIDWFRQKYQEVKQVIRPQKI